MKAIVETVYGWVKGYMLKEANDTGNAQFVADLINAFTVIETIWSKINGR